MRISKRESDYLVDYLKELGTFEAKKYTYINANDEHYKEITVEKYLALNNVIQVTYRFESENWDEVYDVEIPIVDFIVFCSQNKKESK